MLSPLSELRRSHFAIAMTTAISVGCGGNMARDRREAITPIVVRGQSIFRGDKPVRLRGVNRAGTEYACVEGKGTFDGVHDDSLGIAMREWRINVVRIPINEQCWLGYGDRAEHAPAYRDAIVEYVAMFRRHGIVAILDLHWTGHEGANAVRQQAMPSRKYAVAFWSSVAAAFRDQPDVLFDLFNEPRLQPAITGGIDPWTCWRDGCVIKEQEQSYQSAGMQELVDAVRRSGAKNVVLVSGLEYANDLEGWLRYPPRDPSNQLVAAAHIYNFNECRTRECWDRTIAPVAQSVPVVLSEVGEDICTGDFSREVLDWADARAISYLGWTFNPWDCKKGPALIENESGTPTSFGRALKQRLATP